MLLLPAALATACALSCNAWAAKAHEHGVARLELGVEAGRITLTLEVPLEDLVGFERAPRDDAERAAVAGVLARLRDVGRLVRIDAAAGCAAGQAELTAPLWNVPPGGASATAAAAGKADSHGDLEAHYEFRCTTGARAGHVEIGLFDALPRLRRIDVLAVTPRGQMKVVLRRPQARIGLAR
jgi:hypothetical protein